MMTTPDGNYMVITREGAADRKNGIVIADTHDPLHPKPISEFTDGVTSGVHSAFIHTQPKYGTHVYLTNDGTGALHIIDINDPAHPKQVAHVEDAARRRGPRCCTTSTCRTGSLYGSWWNDGLVILDVGNGIKGGSPSNPKFVVAVQVRPRRAVQGRRGRGRPGLHPRHAHGVAPQGLRLHRRRGVRQRRRREALFQRPDPRAHGRLQVLDVSDIEHPKSVAWYEPEYGGVHNVWVAGDTLYMGAYNAGFHAFDISGELRGDLRAQGREIGAPHAPRDPNGNIAERADDVGRGREEGRPGLRERLQQRAVDREDRAEERSRSVSMGWRADHEQSMSMSGQCQNRNAQVPNGLVRHSMRMPVHPDRRSRDTNSPPDRFRDRFPVHHVPPRLRVVRAGGSGT